jgi:hypothetical protein
MMQKLSGWWAVLFGKEKHMHITVICAWCQKFMGIKDAGELDAEAPLTSHSICPACAKRVQKETEEAIISKPNNHKQNTHERRS